MTHEARMLETQATPKTRQIRRSAWQWRIDEYGRIIVSLKS